MSFQATVHTARQLGLAPNSREMQAAARAEILRQQQIQQAQTAIQQQQQARREESNAARALAQAMDTGDTSGLTWMKPAEKTTAAAPAAAATTPQVVPKTLQVNQNVPIGSTYNTKTGILTTPDGNVMYIPNNTAMIKSKTENIGDLDMTPASYSPTMKGIAKRITETGNPVEKGLASAYLWADDPKAVGSPAWYEENVGKALTGGRQNLNEKVETGNVLVDMAANFGRGVVQLPSATVRGVVGGGLSLVSVGRDVAAGDIDNAVRGTVESSVGNFIIGTGKAAVEDPAAFAGGVAAGIALGGAVKGVPRVSVPKPTTVKAPGITIKSNTVVIETPLTGKTKTITTEKITATRNTPGATGKTVTGKVKTDSGLVPAGDFIRPGAGKEGVQSITIKTGNIKVETKNRTVETRKVTATQKTATNETSVILPQQGGKITLQNVTNKTTAKVKTSKTIDTRVKKNAELTRATGAGTARVKSNARVRTATETGKKVSDKTMKTRKQESVYSDTERLKTDYLGKDGTIVLLTADKLNKAGRTRKVTAIEKNNGKPETPKNALPGKVKKTPTVEVKKSGSKEDGTTRKAVYAGQKTAVKRTDSAAGKGKSAKSDTLYLSNGKTGTRMKSTTEKISINPRKMTKGERRANIEQARSDAFYARTKEEVAKERRKANSEKARQQMQAPRLPGKTVKDALRENSELAREAAYVARAQEIKIKKLIKKYGKEEGWKKAEEAGLVHIIRNNPKTTKTPPKTSGGKEGAPKAGEAPKTGNSSRSSGGTARPSGNGMVMMDKPKTGQKQTTSGGGGAGVRLKMKEPQAKTKGRTTTQTQTTTRVKATPKMSIPKTQQQAIKSQIKREMKQHLKTQSWFTLKMTPEEKRERIRAEIKIYLQYLIKLYLTTGSINLTTTEIQEYQRVLFNELYQDLTTELIKTTDTYTEQHQDTETVRKLVVVPEVEVKQIRVAKQEVKQQKQVRIRRKVKTAVIRTRKNKKRLLLKDEEWKKKKSKKAPKKGKNAVRLETVNQFGWLGFDPRPPAKPKLLKLQ